MENTLNTEHFWLVHTGFLLLAASYLVRDMLWLRTIAVVSSSLMITFNLVAYEFPLWGIISWNVFFISINIYNLVKLWRERINIRFNESEQALYDAKFAHMAPFQFRKLIQSAEWQNLDQGAELAVADAPVMALYFVQQGQAHVVKDGAQVAVIAAGAFAGEMSYLTGGVASATVLTSEPAKVVKWPIEQLKADCEKDPALRMAMEGALANDVVDKLRSLTKTQVLKVASAAA